MTTVLNEVQDRLTNLPSMSAPLPYCGTADPTLTVLKTPANPGKPGCTGPATSYYSNPTKFNFEPRFGFAWDPRGDGKTAVRGGFAMFDILLLPGYYYTQQGIESPFYLTGVVTTTPTAPLAGLLGVPASDPRSAYNKIGPTALTGAYMEPNPHRNYIEQWNINVQRQITSSLTATVGYIGSHGDHMMIRGDDGNMVIAPFYRGDDHEVHSGVLIAQWQPKGASCLAWRLYALLSPIPSTTTIFPCEIVLATQTLSAPPRHGHPAILRV